MTAEEALQHTAKTMFTMVRSDRSGEFEFSAELRALGYVILPIQPSAATIEAMAIAMAKDDPLVFEMLSDREAEQTARVAYAAITTDTAKEIKGSGGE